MEPADTRAAHKRPLLALPLFPQANRFCICLPQLLWKQLGQNRRGQVDGWAPLGCRPGPGGECSRESPSSASCRYQMLAWPRGYSQSAGPGHTGQGLTPASRVLTVTAAATGHPSWAWQPCARNRNGLSSSSAPEVTTVINPILHTRKLRRTETKSLVQDTHLLSCRAEILTHPVWPGGTALKPGAQHL